MGHPQLRLGKSFETCFIPPLTWRQPSRLVEMTKLLRYWIRFSMEKGPLHSHNFVISTGAQRSGEICGFLFRFSQ